jgi:hypothetical protein
MTDEGLKYYEDQGLSTLNRYSIRYTSGSDKLPQGWNVDIWALFQMLKIQDGRSIKSLHYGALWYPKVWPEIDEDMDGQLNLLLVEAKSNAAEQKADAESKKFRSRLTRNSSDQGSSSEAFSRNQTRI